MGMGVFEQLAVVLLVCVVAAGAALLLRQPLVVGLIAAGIAVGPQALGIVEAGPEIELLAELGISLLLFIVGLKLDVRVIARLGSVALVTGIGQVALTAGIGYVLAIALGFAVVPALYLALALSFSSTVIIVKLLTDRRAIEDLHGRIAIGLLIVQDLIVVLAMIAITASSDTSGPLSARILGVTLRGAALVAVVALFTRFLATRVTSLLARQSELLVLGAVTWAVAVASTSVLLGFSGEVGAFLAGVSLASTPYRDAIAGRLATLRDFTLVFFFIELGTKLDVGSAFDRLGLAVLLSLFVLVGKPVIVMAILGAMGYRHKVSFEAGLTMAQISEFSLILVALGVTVGQVDSDLLGLVTAVGLITIAASTYLIGASDALHRRLGGALRVFERRLPTRDEGPGDDRTEPDHIVIGLGRFGTTVVEELGGSDARILGVDFDPRGIRARDHDVPVVYGDAADPTLVEHLPLGSASWVVSTVRDFETNLSLVRSLRRAGYAGGVAVASEDARDCALLREAGADVTVQPLHVAAAPLVARMVAHDRAAGAPGD